MFFFVAVSVGSTRKDLFDQYLTQLLQSTEAKSHLPPIQRGQHHVFSAEHTTRDILSFMAQVQGLNVPSESVGQDLPHSLRDIMHLSLRHFILLHHMIVGCNINKSKSCCRLLQNWDIPLPLCNCLLGYRGVNVFACYICHEQAPQIFEPAGSSPASSPSHTTS